MLLGIEKIIFLSQVSIFQTMEAKDLYLVASITNEESYNKNEDVFLDGDPGDKLYIIISGKIEIFKIIEGTKNTFVVIGNNEFFGEMSLFDDTPRSATAKCLEKSQFLTIDKTDFNNLILRYPSLSFSIFKGMSDRIRTMNQKMAKS